MCPTWDSALDWCHPVGTVLQSSLRHKLGVVLCKPEYVENVLIRFPDGATVYLYRGGELHAFPNGHTFITKGFDFGDVKVLNVEKRMELKIGTELPSI